jgi:acetyl-CoA carboxylase carboxyl transferase subunit beta
VPKEQKKSVPAGVWTKCPSCSEMLVETTLRANLFVCPACDHHAGMPVWERIESLADEGSFQQMGSELEPLDPLGFTDTKPYSERIRIARSKSHCTEAVVVGTCQIEGQAAALGVMAFEYLGGSMGSVVGERLTRLFEEALRRRVAAIVCSASGGARMQEGILSLMQMAKTTAAIRRLRDAGVPYLSVLLHPTTGGVAASFSMLGDVNIAEPGALIGFAGPRVIEQTIGEKLPEGFQRAEFLQDHGMVDMIVHRQRLRSCLAFFLSALKPRSERDEP